MLYVLRYETALLVVHAADRADALEQARRLRPDEEPRSVTGTPNAVRFILTPYVRPDDIGLL